ncbi:hypothetical protein BDV59DRAFT_107093 [Aspergillus ambiguus]|uniref:uncharacterized protein n=1 Tax=Aspergillus ambiguus TaxID=176160 RepID=UPI003CCD769C
MPESEPASVIPAQLAFLTIYNPLLGPTDETIQDQVVFYTSRSDQLKRRESSTTRDGEKDSNNEWNERLRQIGLAQGMVSFARNFSEGKAVDYVETDKSYIVLHELEENWWILASVDLTRLPFDPSNVSSSHQNISDVPKYHYSSREMSPPHLLIQQLRRAHSIFLLHHDLSLDSMYQRVGRHTFCTILENFWRRFAWNWEVLLSGNPALDMYDGIKLSAGGELGVGVGEEEWGSGEREVLEDFVSRTDGLVDLIVSRFGDPYLWHKHENADLDQDSEPVQWLGLDVYPRPSDGVIFSGVGGISRPSVAHITQWMEWIYRYGFEAYGVGEDPTSPRRRKRRRKRGRAEKDVDHTSGPSEGPQATNSDRGFSPGIPRPLVIGAPQPSQFAPSSDGQGSSLKSNESSPARSERGAEWMRFRTDTFVKYFTLGYGSSWGPSSESPSPHPRVEALKQEDTSSGGGNQEGSPEDLPEMKQSGTSPVRNTGQSLNQGKFLIGLLDNTASPGGQSVEGPVVTDNLPSESTDVITQRILHVHRPTSDQDITDSVQLRAVVYVHQPFIYTFLFDPETASLTDPSLYQTIHHQLGPLQKPLSNSTSPTNAATRISESKTDTDVSQRFASKDQQLYDIVYDPSNLTVRSSIPNIPDLGSEPLGHNDSSSLPWTRVESLNIHHRLLSTFIETRSRPLELERTCKTSRGWWIVWVRIANIDIEDQKGGGVVNAVGTGDLRQEAFLVRKASDHIPPASHARNSSGTQFFRDLGGAGFGSSRTDTGPAKLVEGLGLDARRYIENLLSLNR